MRKRRIIGAALAVAALGATGAVGPASAAENEPRAETAEDRLSQAGASGRLTLPTGDVVRLSPGGGVSVDAAPGREDVGFVGRTALDGSGDVIVVPTDMLDAIRSGEEDPRRYNVSQLLAAGHTDAGAVSAAELDARDYAGLVPAGEQAEPSDAAQKLSVSLIDRSGDAPEDALAAWIRESTGESGELEIGEDGQAGAELEPGDYLIMTMTFNGSTETERGEAVYGFTPVTVGEEPAELVIDAAAAAPISVEVEREDAELVEHLVYLDASSDTSSMGVYEFMDARIDAYLLPEPASSDLEFNFVYQPMLAGATDGAEPYSYTLAFGGAGSLPDVPAFAVADADLAVEQTEFQDLGVEVEGRQCDYPKLWESQFFLFAQCENRIFPSRMTNLYNAAPVQWDLTTEAGLFDADRRFIEGYTSFSGDVAMPAGPTERVIGDGPLSAGVPLLFRSGDLFAGSISPAGSRSGDTLDLVGYETGSVTLSRDGEELGSAADPADFVFELPEGDQGRYTLTAAATRSTATALFAVDSFLEWKFDSATVEDALVDLPVVALESEAVQNGWAERDEPQEITLTLDSREATAESMSLEVSYDDGQTWTDVELECDTATLEHPDDAAFVSLRLTATDSAGTEVTHTTIRSYGLR